LNKPPPPPPPPRGGGGTLDISIAALQAAFQTGYRAHVTDHGLQCVTFPRWFVTNYTTLTYTRGHNGNTTAASIANVNGLPPPTSTLVGVPSVFSTSGAVATWGGSVGPFGHTGIVLSMNSTTGMATVIHTGNRASGQTPNSWIHNYSFPAASVTFLYLGGHLI